MPILVLTPLSTPSATIPVYTSGSAEYFAPVHCKVYKQIGYRFKKDTITKKYFEYFVIF